MFTGIVEEVGKVVLVLAGSLAISADEVLTGMKPGQSIAVNGVCLTVTEFRKDSFTVGIMPETLSRTNLGSLGIGDEVQYCSLCYWHNGRWRGLRDLPESQ